MPILSLQSGARLAFNQFGAGDPGAARAVLLHGSPGDGRAFARVSKHLRPGQALIMPDLPGNGASDPVRSRGEPPTGAVGAVMAELLDASAEPAWLVGHSHGGNVAVHAAIARPEKVRGLILLEPVLMRALALTGDNAALEDARAHLLAFADSADARVPDAIALMFDYWFGAGAFQRLPAPLRDYLNAGAGRCAADVRAVFADDLGALELAAITCPVTVVHGAASRPVARAIAESIQRLLPHARVAPLAGANHGMLDSHPEAIARIIEAQTGG